MRLSELWRELEIRKLIDEEIHRPRENDSERGTRRTRRPTLDEADEGGNGQPPSEEHP